MSWVKKCIKWNRIYRRKRRAALFARGEIGHWYGVTWIMGNERDDATK